MGGWDPVPVNREEKSILSDGIFKEKMLAIPDGFLVPFKTNGAIKLMDISNNTGPYTLSGTDNSGEWFYHRVQWHDMDGDGDMDIVTCRAREPVIPVIFGMRLYNIYLPIFVFNIYSVLIFCVLLKIAAKCSLSY